MAGNKGYAKTLVRERLQREVDEVLRELYVERRHSQAEIGVALGIPRSMVGRWLAEYGITRDDRPAIEIASV